VLVCIEAIGPMQWFLNLLQRFYCRKLMQKGLGKARVAMTHKLGIRLWIMLRDQIDYQEFCRRGQKQSGGCLCGNAGANHQRKKLLQRPTSLSRWEKRGRGGTEDETVKPLNGIQRV
jgi:hypothetical protein